MGEPDFDCKVGAVEVRLLQPVKELLGDPVVGEVKANALQLSQCEELPSGCHKLSYLSKSWHPCQGRQISQVLVVCIVQLCIFPQTTHNHKQGTSL